MKDLPKIIPVFPLSNFIIFPKTSVPLNIFEPRYIDMIDDAMKSNKFIGMIQPKKSEKNLIVPQLHQIGCLGKISSFKETDDGRYLIELKGLIRFRIIKEINSDKKYRECEVDFESFQKDLNEKKEDLNLERKTNSIYLSKSVQFLGKNQLINKFLTKIADQGITF